VGEGVNFPVRIAYPRKSLMGMRLRTRKRDHPPSLPRAQTTGRRAREQGACEGGCARGGDTKTAWRVRTKQKTLQTDSEASFKRKIVAQAGRFLVCSIVGTTRIQLREGSKYEIAKRAAVRLVKNIRVTHLTIDVIDGLSVREGAHLLFCGNVLRW
jgi:hypothetical protein